MFRLAFKCKNIHYGNQLTSIKTIEPKLYSNIEADTDTNIQSKNFRYLFVISPQKYQTPQDVK